MEGLIQLCTRCGYVLTDYRNAMIPEGDPPLKGWEEGDNIEVVGINPKGLWPTVQPPDCTKQH
jgi:hypothetical protein